MANFDPITGDELPGTYSEQERNSTGVPVIPQAETASQRILHSGYSAASPEDKAAFDTAFSRSQAARTMSLDQVRKLVDSNAQADQSKPFLPSALPRTAEIIAPRESAAQVAGLSIPQRIAAGSMDALDWVGRNILGQIGAAGTVAGELTHGSPIGQALSDAWQGYKQDVADPSQAVANEPWPVRGIAGALTSPMIALAAVPAVGPALSRIAPMLQGIAGPLVQGAASYGLNSADRYAQGADVASALGNETGLQRAFDAAPMLGAVGRGLAPVVQSGARSAAAQSLHHLLLSGAGENHDAVQALVEKGLIPEITNRGIFNGTAKVGRNLLNNLAVIHAERRGVQDAMDAAAAANPELNVPGSLVVPAIKDELSQAALQGPAARDRAQAAIQNVLGEIPGVKPYPPKWVAKGLKKVRIHEGKILDIPISSDVNGKVNQTRPVQISPDIYTDVVSGWKQIPGEPGYDPASLAELNIRPSLADEFKIGLSKQSNWQDKTGKANQSQTNKGAFEGASKSLGNALKDRFEIYQDLMSRMQPYQAAKDAAEHAITIGDRRSLFGNLMDVGLVGGAGAAALSNPLAGGTMLAGAGLRKYLSSGAGTNLAWRLSQARGGGALAGSLGAYAPAISGAVTPSRP